MYIIKIYSHLIKKQYYNDGYKRRKEVSTSRKQDIHACIYTYIYTCIQYHHKDEKRRRKKDSKKENAFFCVSMRIRTSNCMIQPIESWRFT